MAHTTAVPCSWASLASSSADCPRVRLVEPGRRLVGEQQHWIGRQGASDRDPLPLARREAVGAVVEPCSEADLGQRAGGIALETPHEQPQFHVLARAQVRHEPGLLGDEGDVLAAYGSRLGPVQSVDLAALDEHPALGGPVEPGQEMQEGRLAAPGPPDHGGQRAAGERGRDAGEHRPRAPGKRLTTPRSSATTSPGVAARSWNIAGAGVSSVRSSSSLESTSS